MVLVLGAPASAFGQDLTASPDTTIPTLEPITVHGKASGYSTAQSRSATKTPTLLRDVPQSVTVVSKDLIADQNMQGMADVVRYIPGVTMGQGEGNRDQPTIRGNGTTAAFFVDGMRDDVQYFRDLYNVERVEGLKGGNALIFGRGTGGGVLNRVSKEAGWTPIRQLMLQGGSYGNKRGTIDIGQGLSRRVAGRLNAVYENSDLFRNGVTLERFGLNPTATFSAGPRTKITASYEHFEDRRTADRGVPSFSGQPFPADIATFFGDPSLSHSTALVNGGTLAVEHDAQHGLMIRNRSRFTDYDKLYQNVFPGAIDDAGTQVTLSAYNNATARRNLFNQTEFVYRLASGTIRQTILGGVEIGRQITDNFRNTGFFDNTTTSVTAPVSNPTISTPVTFRQSPTDADNHVTNTTVSVYAQNQIALSSRWQAIAGVRFEQFDLEFSNNRNGQALARTDNMISPRAGLLFKPIEPVSFYTSYSVASLPSAGDQFSSLTATSSTLKPEKFANYEVGAKWDLLDNLSLTTSVYRLDRTNTTAPDPNDPSVTVQTGSQRTKGFELGVAGSVIPAWQIAGGYTNQNASVTSRTTAAAVGAKVALVPQNTFSLWNRYQFLPSWGMGLGVVYQDKMFAAIDNAVTLPKFTRFDAAVYYTLNANLRAQLNVENVFDERYYITSNSNNNISPGSPRAVRVSVITGF